MKIINVTPGILPIPPNGWGAVEKIIWETQQALEYYGYPAHIKYLDEITDYDIVHIHVANLANIAHERGIPYYFTMHDHHAYLYGKDSEVYKENMKAIKNAKKAFVPAKYLVGYFGNIPEYFSHGVNVEYYAPTFEPVTEHKLLCVANNGFIHNQTEDRKGFGYAIEAAKLLDLPITIAGPSNNKNYFDSVSHDYDKLTILYDLTESELAELYIKHSIFLHPSILEAGHPNLTILEALSSGLPVIGTYEDGNVLEGMIRVDRDVDQIVKAIKDLISPSTYLIYKMNARAQAFKLSWRNRTKDLIEIYKEGKRQDLINSYLNTEIVAQEPMPDTAKFNQNYISGATFEVTGGPDRDYTVQFIDSATKRIHYSNTIKKNHWVKAGTQYYIDWTVFVDDGVNSYEFKPDYKDKRVYIALDSKALGDTLAWFPYIDEFRKKHDCKIICSTFWNNFFEEEYPHIEFVKPGDVVHNLYAMYTIGWFYHADGRIDYDKHPRDFRPQPLQKTAADILGLDFEEVKPRVKAKKDVPKEKVITIGFHSTTQAKYWNNPEGWQSVVDFLKSKGYRVIMLSKEEDGYMGNNYPKGVEVLTDHDIDYVIWNLQRSHLFIGISSGLSWLSWAVGTKTCLISGFTEAYNEFQDGIRIFTKDEICRGCCNVERLDAGDWNWCPRHKNTGRQFECTKTITSEDVIKEIAEYI